MRPDADPALYYRLPGQELVQGRIDEGVIRWMDPKGGDMPPNRRNRPQLCMRHLLDLQLVVPHPKIEIRCAGHHDGPRLDGPQGGSEIALIALVGTDVGMLPRPQH